MSASIIEAGRNNGRSSPRSAVFQHCPGGDLWNYATGVWSNYCIHRILIMFRVFYAVNAAAGGATSAGG